MWRSQCGRFLGSDHLPHRRRRRLDHHVETGAVTRLHRPLVQPRHHTRLVGRSADHAPQRGRRGRPCARSLRGTPPRSARSSIRAPRRHRGPSLQPWPGSPRGGAVDTEGGGWPGVATPASANMSAGGPRTARRRPRPDTGNTTGPDRSLDREHAGTLPAERRANIGGQGGSSGPGAGRSARNRSRLDWPRRASRPRSVDRPRSRSAVRRSSAPTNTRPGGVHANGTR